MNHPLGATTIVRKVLALLDFSQRIATLETQELS
jgi:hypothetical protein